MALMVGLIASSLTAANAYTCRYQHCEDGGEKKYKLYLQEKTWEDAKDYCLSSDGGGGDYWNGGQLATWGSDAEYERISQLLYFGTTYNDARCWIGLHDGDGDSDRNLDEGYWKFVDGDISYCADFGSDWNCDTLPQWNSGEPNNAGSAEDCGEVVAYNSRDIKLNDAVCSNTQYFMCEYRCHHEWWEWEKCDRWDDEVIADVNLPPVKPYGPRTAPRPNFALDFTSARQGLVFFALAASNLIWMTVAVYCCCMFKKGKATYSKVAQFSEDECLNA